MEGSNSFGTTNSIDYENKNITAAYGNTSLYNASDEGVPGADQWAIVVAGLKMQLGMRSLMADHIESMKLSDIARRVHMAGNAEQFGAGIVRTAKAGKPAGTAPQNRRHDRNRFNIVDGCRAAIKSRIGREWRLQSRLPLFAF